jgi:uncharacterized protein (DUF2235 family)
MPKNIVICCDGTGNEINTTISNVLKLYRVLEKSDDQRVYYNPGVGTIGEQNAWERFKQNTKAVLGLATGYGLDHDVLGAYRFLCETYQSGDRVWLFGFSRGAYTVRVLAAFVHVMGLLRPDQLNLAGYALSAYKKASSDKQASDGDSQHHTLLEEAWHFSQVAGGYPVPIEFIGVWDTVASVIVPRQDGFLFLFYLQMLYFTRTNPSVKKFRQAMSIDERRRMFRLNRWIDPQGCRSNIYDPKTATPQDIRQVWFAGVHSDVGGGYPEAQSGLSKFPLLWMIDEAQKAGLRVDDAMVNHFGWGQPIPGGHDYVAPDATAPLHDSLTGAWWILEWLPKSVKWREWPARKSFLGLYLPLGEPRVIPEGALLHRSVIERRDKVQSYRPINMPKAYSVEETPLVPRHADGANAVSSQAQPPQ